MRVLTQNVWARHGDWPARRDLLRAGFADLRPDLVALQETVVTEGYDQVADLLGSGYHTVHQSRREPDGTGMSLASRWPVTRTDETDLLVSDRTDPREFVGSLLVAVVSAPPPYGTVLFASPKPSFRLGLEAERELQAVLAARRLGELAADCDHVLLASDFDATPDSASMRFWAGRQSLDGLSVAHQDAWEAVHADAPGPTFTPQNALVAASAWAHTPPRRIDYVLVGCGPRGPSLAIDSCERVFETDVEGVWASDHFGVVADLSPR